MSLDWIVSEAEKNFQKFHSYHCFAVRMGGCSSHRTRRCTFFPPISEIAAAWWQLLLSGDLLEHTIASLSRSLGGFTLAILISIPLGLAIGWWKPVSEYLNPLLELLRNTAALAILPVFILLLGLGETSKDCHRALCLRFPAATKHH